MTETDDILLVDDDKEVRELGKAMLEGRVGQDVSVDLSPRPDPSEAASYAVVISDYRFDQFDREAYDGLDFYQDLLDEGFTGTFLICTGYTEDDITGLDDFEGLGEDDVFRKPLDYDVLVRRVEDARGSHDAYGGASESAMTD